MDEAERCHRLAFISGGVLLDVGTPDEIVQRRALRVAELDVEQSRVAASILRSSPDVEEISHYGQLMRVVTRRGADPVALAQQMLEAAGVAVKSARETRATVEDAFVAIARVDPRAS
jgi:ABC-2 type transport system ATP-binding protein